MNIKEYIDREGGEYIASEILKRDVTIELTQAEYDLLSSEEKNNGAVYYVTDEKSPARILKNGIEYGSTMPPIGDGLTINSITGELEIVTATDDEITNLIDSIALSLNE